MKISDMESASEYVCEVAGEGHVATVTLVESAPGAGDWSVAGVQVATTDGATLSADRLRNFAWASVLESARSQARKAGADTSSTRFARPSDPPPAFRADRRGRAGRTERDYAELAACYIALGSPERRRKAASEWSKNFGRQPGRWRADIARAKAYVEPGVVERMGKPVMDLMLSEEGMCHLYGDNWRDAFAVESAVDDAEETFRMLGEAGVGTAERAKLDVRLGRIARERGWTEAEVRAAWRRRLQGDLGIYYSGGQ